MTHRHRKFWREAETNKIYSRCYCGVDVHMNHIGDGKKWQWREHLMQNYHAARVAFVEHKVDYVSDTFHPELVMDITNEKSTCDECESLYGLQVLGDL